MLLRRRRGGRPAWSDWRQLWAAWRGAPARRCRSTLSWPNAACPPSCAPARVGLSLARSLPWRGCGGEAKGLPGFFGLGVVAVAGERFPCVCVLGGGHLCCQQGGG